MINHKSAGAVQRHRVVNLSLCSRPVRVLCRGMKASGSHRARLLHAIRMKMIWRFHAAAMSAACRSVIKEPHATERIRTSFADRRWQQTEDA